MVDFKQVSIVSHALHSRLQLIRTKLYCYKDMSTDDFINANWKYFEAASISVLTREKLSVTTNGHWRDAARMFLSVAGDLFK